jgi:hypothetical protein
MADVCDLAAERRRKLMDKNASDIAPIDAVRDCLAQMESGVLNPSRIAIHYMEEINGEMAYGAFCAGMGFEEHITMLNVALRDELNDYYP